jgi:hypothetical protein
MTPTLCPATLETLITDFFRRSAGEWRSQRRYYTLNGTEEPQEVASDITVVFLTPGAPELEHLAGLHQLDSAVNLVCGARVTWESHYPQPHRKPSKGSTIFGAEGAILYRDRGFATAKPVVADYNFTNPETMTLKTEYNGASFEEELKLIGAQYRTRQTIISRAGQEQMIGQYLETRLS